MSAFEGESSSETPFSPPTGMWSLVGLLILTCDSSAEEQKRKRMIAFLEDADGHPAMAGEILQVRCQLSTRCQTTAVFVQGFPRLTNSQVRQGTEHHMGRVPAGTHVISDAVQDVHVIDCDMRFAVAVRTCTVVDWHDQQIRKRFLMLISGHVNECLLGV